jgi:hypothetical protein
MRALRDWSMKHPQSQDRIRYLRIQVTRLGQAKQASRSSQLRLLEESKTTAMTQ